MGYFVLALLAVGGLFKVAATYQFHGYAWAVCSRVQFLCTDPNLVLLVAIVVATIVATFGFLRSKSY
jgi:hypothetical protein